MLTFHESMDPHSLDIRKNGEGIAFLQWHTGEFKTIFRGTPGLTIWISEWQQIQEKVNEIQERIARERSHG